MLVKNALQVLCLCPYYFSTWNNRRILVSYREICYYSYHTYHFATMLSLITRYKNQIGTCVYQTLSGIAKDEGNGVGDIQNIQNPSKCQKPCDDASSCKSFAYFAKVKRCHLKDRKITTATPKKGHDQCTTWYKVCSACSVISNEVLISVV